MPKFGDYTEAVTLNNADILLLKQGSSTVKATILQITQKVIEDTPPVASSVSDGIYSRFILPGLEIKDGVPASIPLFSIPEGSFCFVESITIIEKKKRSTANTLADVHLSLRKTYTNIYGVPTGSPVIGNATNPIKITFPVGQAYMELGYDGGVGGVGVAKMYSIAARTKTLSSTGVEDVRYPTNYDWDAVTPAEDYILEIHEIPNNYLPDDRCTVDIHVVYRTVTL